MMIRVLLQLIWICGVAAVMGSCSTKGGDSTVSLPRDTTITEEEAVTRLLLDSLYVEQFLDAHAIEEETGKKMINFYNSRNYQFAWFSEEGLTESAASFWNLHQKRIEIFRDSSYYDEHLHNQVEAVLHGDTTYLDSTIRRLELKLTQHFFRFLTASFNGKVSPEEMQWHIPRRKINDEALLDSLVNGASKSWRPLTAAFYQLQERLTQYAAIAKRGGWPEIARKGTLRKNAKDSAVVQLKKRLLMGGYYTDTADSSMVFTPALQDAVKTAQRSFGLKETGVVDKSLLEELNVPADERIKQMVVNLERMRWMPQQAPNRLVANIPEFRLHIIEQNVEVSQMRIVVGTAATRSVIFSDELEFVVFSPYWNIPRSIVRNEILPSMRRRSNYLQRNNMEITGYSNGLPVVRQKPGKSNALGRVKFIFPNRFNIYFHDTPAKTLFERQERAFSHGCIRLARPFDLAKYLLRDQEAWDDEAIKEAMNAQEEKWIRLEQPVEVYIVYFTSWVDAAGLLNFRNDIYGHDSRMKTNLFE